MARPPNIGRNGVKTNGSSVNFETRYQFELFRIDEKNNIRTPVHRTFERAIDNLEARFSDSQQELNLASPVNITNLFANVGETISPEGTPEPLTLDLTTRLVRDAKTHLTLPAEILPLPVEYEPLANLVGGDEIEFPRRLEYIINGDEFNHLPSNIRELTLIIEDTDEEKPGFQDDNGHTIITEDHIHDALNDIEFIIDNQLLGFSESNEEGTGIVDRVRVSRLIEDDESRSSEFQILSNEQNINFQNSIPTFGPPIEETEPIIIEAEDLKLHGYQEEFVPPNQRVISLLNTSDITGTATLNVDDFSIDPGTYDLTLNVFDENDGKAQLKVFVNDQIVGDPIILDQNLGSDYATEENRREIVLQDITINSSDIITIEATANMQEWARVDFLQFDFV